MEPTIDGGSWRDELKRYIRSIENISETALKSIKQDRIRNNLPFDDSFKDFILRLTSGRINNVFTNLLFEEILDDVESLPNRNVSEQNSENGRVNIGQPLTWTMTISPESIDQVPPKNQSLTSNAIDSGTCGATFVRDGNQLSEQITIFMPSNQTTSTVQSELEVDLNLQQDLSTQNNRTELLKTSGGVENELRKEIPCETVANASPMNESNTSSDSVNGPNAIAKKLDTGTKLTGAHRSKRDELYKQVVNSNMHKPETIDLISDEEEAADTVDTDRNSDGQIQSNVQRQNGCEPIGRQEISNTEHPKIIDLMSSNQGSVTKDINHASEGTENAERREEMNHVEIVSGNLKKKPKQSIAVHTTKQHKCDCCEYSTKYKWCLNNHNRIHTGERPYGCEVCEKRFTERSALKRHMKIHRNMFAFQCSNCRHGFSDEVLWKSHENSCTTVKYECHLCKKVVWKKQDLIDHMRKHTGDKLRCSKCRKQFSSKSGLTEHMKLHGKLFRFQCSRCRQGFLTTKLWESHERRCKAKQYECYLCSKKFYQQKGHMLEHMRHKHSGVKPFSCPKCSEQFCSKSNMKQHTKRHH